MQSRKVIFVNRFFYPDHSATSQLLSDLAFSLTEKDYLVSVITSGQLYDRPAARLVRDEVIQGVRVFRVRSARFGRHGLLGRMLDYLTFYLSAALCLYRLARHGDVVVAKTDPPLISAIAAPIAVLRRAHLINWVQDLFPEVAMELGIKGISRVTPFLLSMRNKSLKRAKQNVVLGKRMAERLIGSDVPPDRIVTIHNWADGDLILPIAPQSNGLRTAWNLGGKFVVGYSGNMGRAHDFEAILEAIERLCSRPDIVFVFIGGGEQRVVVERFARERNLPNVVFQAYQPREQLAYSLSVPDVHLISLLPRLEGLIVPSKFYGICAAGRATLYVGDPEGEIPQIIRTVGCGNTVEPGNAAGLADVIEKWSKNPKIVRAMGQRARAEFERSFDKRYAIQTWSGILDSLISGEFDHGTATSGSIPF